jgi:hypothetical protein
MTILSRVAPKPYTFLRLRSVGRAAFRVGQVCFNLLGNAAEARGRAIATTYLTAMGIDASCNSVGTGRRHNRDY